jgi:hypothetical protein
VRAARDEGRALRIELGPRESSRRLRRRPRDSFEKIPVELTETTLARTGAAGGVQHGLYERAKHI